ncbi:MAG TPA: hypothetical protein PK193_00780, partial [Candidatus Paceibacterota bacterium]|nr:hypothetical protein [Candidatus Paceibacterota bacterium]
MKKILPYIFILTIIVQLFAPFSVSQKDNNGQKKIFSRENVVFAEDEETQSSTENSSFIQHNVNIEIKWEAGKEYIKVIATVTGNPDSYSLGANNSESDSYELWVSLYNSKDRKEGEEKVELEGGAGPKDYEFLFEGLNENTTYTAYTQLFHVKLKTTTPNIASSNYLGSSVSKTLVGEKIENKITTTTSDDEIIQNRGGNISDSGITRRQLAEVASSEPLADDAFDCSIGNLRGCFAEFAYTIIFKPAAFLFGLTGKALDFTLMYSLDDKSYRSVFVVEGWGIVRDICNLFFIFILLYIAFKVVLGLGSGKSDPKSLIINVIIIGLLINFSLFATRLIIDASNILSRVFYNSETISFKSSSGADVTLGSAGEIKFSEVLVQKVNPVSLLTESGSVGLMGGKSENMSGALEEAEQEQNVGATRGEKSIFVDKTIPIGLGTFIIMCILIAAICIIGIVVFFNLTFVFIARVVMLWLAMILSPIAFFSHTTPELENLKFIGFKNWLKETASMAFVAPIFCFFLYIIITFLDSGLGITDAYRSPTGFEFVLRILIPFLFLSVLLMKAKDIAISMSGQAGKFVSDMGNKITGTTIGLAAGGAAMAMRGTVGAMGARMARSETLTNME